jgi:hypothetical protein
LDRIGLLAKIVDSESCIDQGRKWLDTAGFEPDGRIRYRFGLSMALDAFKEAQDFAQDDLEALILAEYSFLSQELQFCGQSDTQAIGSLEQAIQGFDDAFLSAGMDCTASTRSMVLLLKLAIQRSMSR